MNRQQQQQQQHQHQHQPQPQQHQQHFHHHQQQQLYNNMYGAHAHAFMPQMLPSQQQPMPYSMGMTSPTMGSFSPPRMAHRIPIVNPDNGNVVAIPESAPSPGWHQHHFVAVR